MMVTGSSPSSLTWSSRKREEGESVTPLESPSRSRAGETGSAVRLEEISQPGQASPLSWTPPSQQTMLKLLASANPSKASPAPDYDAQFRRTSGWVGADGTYSVPMPDGSTVWLFSDTFLGDVLPDGRRAPGTAFVNNTVAHQKAPGQVEFFNGGSHEQPEALFTPPDGKGWFWLHDAVASGDGKVHVMLGQFDRTPDGGALGFEAIGGWLAQMEMAEGGPRVSGYQKLPHFQKAAPGQPSIFFGTSMMRDGDHLYVYGVRDHAFTKEAVLARVKPEQVGQSDTWEFFDGEGWSANMEQAKPVANDVSVEQSVHKTAKGDFAMIAQGGGISANVVVRRAPRPEGPWSEPEIVYVAPENQGQDVTYNAKAHPELSDSRGLLVSYNVNTLDWDRNLADGHIYRPRFIRLQDPTLLPAK